MSLEKASLREVMGWWRRKRLVEEEVEERERIKEEYIFYCCFIVVKPEFLHVANAEARGTVVEERRERWVGVGGKDIHWLHNVRERLERITGRRRSRSGLVFFCMCKIVLCCIFLFFIFYSGIQS